MERAIIAITEGGLRLAKTIAQKCNSRIFTLDKYADGKELIAMNSCLKEFMGKAFKEFSEIIMIMSCGIAVRSIAEHLDSKLNDPAVVVMDELGQNVISLISGHIGGANALARELEALTGGKAVITTASDILGIEAVDTMAVRLGLEVVDYEQAKLVTSCMVNGKRAGVYSESSDIIVDSSLFVIGSIASLKEHKLEALIYIGHKLPAGLSDMKIPIAQLLKKNLVLGIGCKRDIEEEKFLDAFQRLCRENGISEKAFKKIATIALKKEEPCILKLSKYLGIPLEVISTDKIIEVENRFECSELVRSVAGVGCVAEPCAYIASGYGECVLHRTKLGGITMSIYIEATEETDEG